LNLKRDILVSKFAASNEACTATLRWEGADEKSREEDEFDWRGMLHDDEDGSDDDDGAGKDDVDDDDDDDDDDDSDDSSGDSPRGGRGDGGSDRGDRVEF
jgi:hypothetical protein